MIRINLLPFRAARKKANVRQQVSVFLLSFVFIAIGAFYYHISLNSRIDDLNSNIEDTENKMKKFRKINIELAVIKRELKELNTKLEVIQILDLNREGPVRLLDAMTGIVVPKRMWFTELEAKDVKAVVKETTKKKEGTTQKTEEIVKKVIIIKGTALDNKTVADFMTRLETSKLFTNVELMTLKREKETDDQNLKSFQVKCVNVRLQSTEEKAAK